MNVLFLTMFVSLVLATLGVFLFVWTAKSRTFDHDDRLALLPLESDESRPRPAPRAGGRSKNDQEAT